ncbi:MAG TPA: NUDIX hydrolase [Chloroflexota bacterium]
MERMYPVRPWIAVGVIVVRDGKVLLVQRGKEPGRGFWAVPGGMVDLGETSRQAAAREAREETGLDVGVGEVFWVADAIRRDADGRVSYHNVIVDFLAYAPSGDPVCGDDAMDVRWCGPEELAEIEPTPTMWPLLEKLFSQSFAHRYAAGGH